MVLQKHKDLKLGKERAIENLKRISNLEYENRRLKAIVELHPINIKLERNDAANMAYIHFFSNAIWPTHRTDLNLEGIWAQMKEMFLDYMRNNPVHLENHFSLKDLVAF